MTSVILGIQVRPNRRHGDPSRESGGEGRDVAASIDGIFRIGIGGTTRLSEEVFSAIVKRQFFSIGACIIKSSCSRRHDSRCVDRKSLHICRRGAIIA